MNGFSIKAKGKEIRLKGPALNDAILQTMHTLSQIVGSTLGPGGNVVLLERIGLPPLITKDGVTVASNVAFKDATQYVLGEAAKEASLRTNVEAGDGTTTVIVLAEALTRYGLEYLSKHPNKSPQEICRELDAVVEKCVARLQKAAKKVTTKQDLHKVALVSANFDESIAGAVIEALDQVGNDGTIITEEGSSRHTTVEMQEGFPVRKGLSTFGAVQEIFINDPQAQECVLQNPMVLLYDGDLTDPINLANYLQKCYTKMMEEKQSASPIIVVAHKFSPQVLRLMAENFAVNRAQIIPMETMASAQPMSRHHFLHDMAAYLGADVLDPIAHQLDVSTPEALGGCGRARIGRYQSVLFDPLDGTEPLVEKRITELKGQLENAESEYDAEIIKERIGHLLGGIATIYVGGSSDLEIKEKKHRIEDAICATRSAVEQGIVPGGGAMFLALADSLLDESFVTEVESSDILVQALQIPFQRILLNVGESRQKIEEATQKIIDSRNRMGVPKLVYDALHHTYAKPFKAGIVDPVKVTVATLQNAMSIAQMLFTLGGAVILPRDLEEERQAELQAQAVAAQMQGA